jgi:hypothetical protein
MEDRLDRLLLVDMGGAKIGTYYSTAGRNALHMSRAATMDVSHCHSVRDLVGGNQHVPSVASKAHVPLNLAHEPKDEEWPSRQYIAIVPSHSVKTLHDTLSDDGLVLYYKG